MIIYSVDIPLTEMAAHVPAVVKFAFHDFRISEKKEGGIMKKKWHAKCNVCQIGITETSGTTSSFTRYACCLQWSVVWGHR